MAAFFRASTIPPDMGAPLAKSVRPVAPVAALLGEGPIFDPRDGRLYFLDIKGGGLFAYDPQTEKTETFAAPGEVSALALHRKGGFVCARRDGFARLSLLEGGLEFEAITDPEKDMPGNRFNDGKADPAGGFWAGTMDDSQKDDKAGSWWRLSPRGDARKIDAGFHVTNGPAFDVARGRVYFTDSARRTIYAARIDDNGFGAREVFLTFEEADGYPDGMDVDAEGHLWVAFWDGAAVRRFSPEGALLEVVQIPAPRPTSVALVGDRAYVTSARIGLSAAEIEMAPLSGALFEIALAKKVSVAPLWFEG
jgi:sugar lactone lactonase YvrE